MEYNQRTILIVEDSENISNLIALHLENKYSIIQAYSGEQALEQFKSNEIDLIILDIMLPRLNGYEILKFVRKRKNIPIIILSAKITNEEKIIGLNLGADDYISKPFNPLELVARVDAQFRRFYKLGGASCEEEETYQIKDLILDCKECCLYKGENKLSLTNIEYKLLKLFMSEPGRVFTKKQIFENVWEEEYNYDDNTIMVYISKLRDYIEDTCKKTRYITTVRGLGYRFEK